LKEEWVKWTERKLRFTVIRSFEFTDVREEGPIILSFQAGKMSQGDLRLYSMPKVTKEKGFQETIRLPGYPANIIRKGTIPEDPNLMAESQMLYPEEVDEKLHKKEK
jgi:hypothetical protein